MKETKYDLLLNPRGIAVIGASSKPGSYGLAVIKYLKDHGYPGAIYPINPNYDEILGYRCYKRVADVSEPLDAAVVLSPGKVTLPVLTELAEVGTALAVVPGDVIDTDMRQQVINLVNRTGMRIVGPNCVGLAHFHHNSILSISSALRLPEIIPGAIGVISQSGGILGAVLDRAAVQNIGLSMIVSSGTELDMGIHDFINVMAEDPHTKAISIYLETFRKPKQFFEAAAKAIAVGKPVIVLKGGRTEAGAISAMSHSGRMAGEYAIIQALFRKYRIIEATHLDDLFTVPDILVRVKPPCDGIALVSLSGGTCTYVTDALSDSGVRLSSLTPETKEKLTVIAGKRGTYNPLDADVGGPGAGPKNIHDALLILDSDETVGTMVMTDTILLPTKELAEEVVCASTKTRKPIVACWPVGKVASDGLHILAENSIPTFTDCNRFATAMSALSEWIRIRALTRDMASGTAVPEDKSIKPQMCRILSDLPSGSLDEATSKSILSEFGIPIVPECIARSPEEAAVAAERIGYPIALKILSADIPHKTEAGGVKLGLTSSEDVEEAFKLVEKAVHNYNPSANIEGVLIQKMITDGVELLAGVRNDPGLGMVVVFGAGGIWTEMLGGIRLVAGPISLAEANSLIMDSKVYTLLRGYRGKPTANIQAVAETLVALSRIAVNLGDRLSEIDINPLIALPNGVVAVDGLIVLRENLKTSAGL